MSWKSARAGAHSQSACAPRRVPSPRWKSTPIWPPGCGPHCPRARVVRADALKADLRALLAGGEGGKGGTDGGGRGGPEMPDRRQSALQHRHPLAAPPVRDDGSGGRSARHAAGRSGRTTAAPHGTKALRRIVRHGPVPVPNRAAVRRRRGELLATTQGAVDLRASIGSPAPILLGGCAAAAAANRLRQTPKSSRQCLRIHADRLGVPWRSTPACGQRT